jgi:PAS domain S-box-containing protein
MAKRPLAAESNELAEFLERMTDAFIALDREWRVTYMNAAAEQLNAKPRSETIGRSHWDEWPHTVGSEVERRYRDAMTTQRAEHFEHHYMVPGQDFWHSIHAYPSESGLSIFFRDVTEGHRLSLENARLYEAERQARLEAEEARARAEEANRTKADFLSTMSHELRTPLNAIGGYVQLLQMGLRGPLSEQQKLDLERIARNQLHVTSLINDVLNFARLEAGRVQFDTKRVAVADLVAQLEGFIAPQIAERKQDVRIRPCDPDVAVWADPDKTTQILLNLLSNALKHTPAGSPVDVYCDEGRERPGRVRITVRDVGPGIPADKQQKIFEPFVQIGRQLNMPIEGIGLGLAISRDLARGMGGELTVQSEPGKGAAFTVTLPAASS